MKKVLLSLAVGSAFVLGLVGCERPQTEEQQGQEQGTQLGQEQGGLGQEQEEQRTQPSFGEPEGTEGTEGTQGMGESEQP